MAEFVYTGTEERVFLRPPMVVAPGDVIEADENPDPYWFEPEKPSPTPRLPRNEKE